MLIIEATLVVLCGLLLFVFTSLEFAYSVILGGLAFIVPNVIFVRFSLRTSAADSSSNVLAWFYIGEAVKIVTTIIIFVAAALLLVAPLKIGLMFVTYGFVLLVNLTGLAILMNK